jgi:hypothetical protein
MPPMSLSLSDVRPKPDRFIKDSLTSADSANLSDPNKRDHWMFGAG